MRDDSSRLKSFLDPFPWQTKQHCSPAGNAACLVLLPKIHRAASFRPGACLSAENACLNFASIWHLFQLHLLPNSDQAALRKACAAEQGMITPFHKLDGFDRSIQGGQPTRQPRQQLRQQPGAREAVAEAGGHAWQRCLATAAG